MSFELQDPFLIDDRNVLVSNRCSKTLEDLLYLLPPLSKEGPWVAGSAVTRTLKDSLAGNVYPISSLDLDRLSDVDVFFANMEQAQSFIAELKKMHPGEVNEREPDFETELYEDTGGLFHQTFNVFTVKGELIVQCVLVDFYKSMQELIDSFDFTHCQFATDGTNTIYYQRSHDCWSTKTLEVNKITRPKSSVFRLCKYAIQGYKPSDQCLDIFAPKPSL